MGHSVRQSADERQNCSLYDGVGIGAETLPSVHNPQF